MPDGAKPEPGGDQILTAASVTSDNNSSNNQLGPDEYGLA